MSSFAAGPNSIGSLTNLPVDSGISKFFWTLFEKANGIDQDGGGKYTDGKIVLRHNGSEHTFFIHRMVLSMWSPYFEEKFYGNRTGLPKDCVQLEDINPTDCYAVLKYMYNEKLAIDFPKKASNIYAVAENFKIAALMKYCKNELHHIKILPSNVFEMLQASMDLQNMCITDNCLSFFRKHAKEVIAETHNLSIISPTMMAMCLSSTSTIPVLNLDSVYDLFVWVFAWAKNVTLKDHRFHSPRVPLEELLPHLPFASLKAEEFAKMYSCYKDTILTKDEVINIFMEYSLPGGQLPSWYNKDCKIEVSGAPNEVNERQLSLLQVNNRQFNRQFLK